MTQANLIRSGFKYVTNSKGKVEGVVLNLKNQAIRELWEDLTDTLMASERTEEPTRPFDEVKREILAQRQKGKQ